MTMLPNSLKNISELTMIKAIKVIAYTMVGAIALFGLFFAAIVLGSIVELVLGKV